MDLLQLITGLLVAGESIALFIGMKLQKSEWLNPVNIGYIVFDVLIGVSLVGASIGVIPTQMILVVTSVITHLIRDYDHCKQVPDRYAFNIPLLVLLNLRLVMLFAILVQ